MQDSDKIISYHEMVAMEKMSLQRGMIFSDDKRRYSILLMSQRKNAVYNDDFDENGNLTYEGHDARAENNINPKEIDKISEFIKNDKVNNGETYYFLFKYSDYFLVDPQNL